MFPWPVYSPESRPSTAKPTSACAATPAQGTIDSTGRLALAASVISGNSGGGVYNFLGTVSLSGTGIAPVLTLSSEAWTVGNPLEFLGSGTSKVVTVANTGTAPLTISLITITGTNASEFLPYTTTCGASLAAPVPLATST
jgi:hypothetical protein